MNWRLFVGLAVPEPANSCLIKICQGLPGIRWQKRENLHVTLKFIGQTDDAGFARIDSVLSAACPAKGPVPLKIQGVGIFGEARHPRALWAGIVPDRKLLQLRGDIETELAEQAGFAAEGRAFHPHVTLAKPKNFPARLIEAYLENHADFALPEFTANEVLLFSSRTGSKDAKYRVEKTYVLGRGGRHS